MQMEILYSVISCVKRRGNEIHCAHINFCIYLPYRSVKRAVRNEMQVQVSSIPYVVQQ